MKIKTRTTRSPLCLVLAAAGWLGMAMIPTMGTAQADWPTQGAEATQQVTLDLLQAEGVALQDWSYAAGDGQGAAPPVSGWAPALSYLPRKNSPPDWSGTGWFRLRFVAPPALVDELLGLVFETHLGASKVYLGSRLVGEIGTIAQSSNSDALTIEARNQVDPFFFRVEQPGSHTLYVWFANPRLATYHRVGSRAGFSATLYTGERASTAVRLRQRTLVNLRGLFTGIFLSFSLLHLLLYLFRREALENLYFSLFCLVMTALAFLLVHKELVEDPRIRFWSESLMNAAGLGFGIVGVLFVYRALSRPIPRVLRWALVVVGALIPVVVVWPAATVLFVFASILGGLLEMARRVFLSWFRREEGASILGLGILAINAGFGAGILANLGLLPSGIQLGVQVPFGSVLVLIVCMSLFLARRFAMTHQKLEHQLERVKVLSEERLEQERRASEHEVKTKLLEADIARKAEELEEARLLQLSMLPQHLPRHPELEIAAHMTTATEVGGDYYDFDVCPDGVVTVAVGDATGHGMRAGTMVTATKSLFNALGRDSDMVGTVNRANVALKRMNLRSLNMALLLARYNNRTLRVAAAGMPQPLIYRCGSGTIETLDVGGMPLGCLRSFPYSSVEVALEEGDKVLFMSDGFPERLNAEGHQLGYPACEALFAKLGHLAVDPLMDLCQPAKRGRKVWPPTMM